MITPAYTPTPLLDRYTSMGGEILSHIGCTPTQVVQFAQLWEERCWPILAEALAQPTAGRDANRRRETLQAIAADAQADAREFDGKPFTGRTVAEYLGNQGAAIAALARIVETLLPEVTQ